LGEKKPFWILEFDPAKQSEVSLMKRLMDPQSHKSVAATDVCAQIQNSFAVGDLRIQDSA
jgi:hypothetical protein